MLRLRVRFSGRVQGVGFRAFASAEARVRGEAFTALPNEYCRFCAYRRSCPASEEGGEVLP